MALLGVVVLVGFDAIEGIVEILGGCGIFILLPPAELVQGLAMNGVHDDYFYLYSRPV